MYIPSFHYCKPDQPQITIMIGAQHFSMLSEKIKCQNLRLRMETEMMKHKKCSKKSKEEKNKILKADKYSFQLQIQIPTDKYL